MGKYKKKQRQEKSKVQLKKSEKTKFLPKGQNVTNTAFKIKPIVLPDQLKLKDDDVPLSKRKLDVKDLMQRMRHYNENVRHKACLEMVDMMKFHHEEIVKNHLATILQIVPTLIQDKAVNVRRSSVKVIDALLSHTSCNKIEPFFDFISVNLRCAMTNINRYIQEDSLLLLDVLLKYTQPLLAKNYMKILSDFFTLISKLRSDSHFGKTLTVDLGSKLTSVKWRLKALSRLHLLLNAIITETCKTKRERQKPSKVCFYDDPNSYPLLIQPVADANLKLNFDNYKHMGQTEDKQSVLDKHLACLVQLLYETWIEVVPEKLTKTEYTTLNDESASVLCCIMRILRSLWTYTKLNNSVSAQEIFFSKEGTKFLAHLIRNFPYSQGQTVKAKKRDKTLDGVMERNSDPKCMEQNLLICYIYSVLKIQQKSKDKKIDTVVSYLTRILLSKSHPHSENIEFIVLLLQSILNEDTKKWISHGVDVQTILQNVIIFYNNARLYENAKSAIFEILAKVPDNNLLVQSHEYNNWISNIIKDLTKPKISSKKVNFLLNLAKQNNVTFQADFVDNLGDILRNLDSIQITGDVDNVSVKKNIINILFYVHLNINQLQIISDFANESCNMSFYPYVRQMLILVSNKN